MYTGKGQSVPRNVVSVRFAFNVTEAEREAFFRCRNLREVVFNEGLRTIRRNAFCGCIFLQRITLPSTLTEIGDDAFNGCRSLREVGLNDCLKKIRGGAFYCCNLLESITIPSTLTEIGTHAFGNCTSLRKAILHENLQKIGAYAFAGCNQLERFTFPCISTRLNNVLEVNTTEANRTRQLNEIDAIRGDMIVRNGTELFVPGEVLRGGSNWNTIKASLDQIISWIRYYEIKEATTQLELALWKAKIDQADETTDINREAYRIEVPGPVKDAILQYL